MTKYLVCNRSLPSNVLSVFSALLSVFLSVPFSLLLSATLLQCLFAWREFLCTPDTETPEQAFQEPSANQTGFLEARSGVYVFRVP